MFYKLISCGLLIKLFIIYRLSLKSFISSFNYEFLIFHFLKIFDKILLYYYHFH